MTAFLGAGLLVLVRALGRVRSVTSDPAAAVDRLGHGAWRAALRARLHGPVRVLGVAPSLPMELLAIPLALIPLAFASAIVRYRLMDVEVILKRLLVYTAVLAAIAGDLRASFCGRRAAFSSRPRTSIAG